MTTTTTMIDLIGPRQADRKRIFDISVVLAGSLIIAISAQIAVLLPFSPVPVTGQTLAVLLLAALLGSKRASLTVLAYLLEGLAGLPVFAGARGGPAAIIGPTGGYLVAFIAAAYVVGLLAEIGADRRFATTVLAMIVGNAIIYIGGIAWLSCLISLSRVEFGFNRLLTMGVYPFIVGDALKILLAGLLLPLGWRILGRTQRGKDHK